MKCLAKEIIIQYLDNELSDTEKKEIENHLSICERCRRTVREIKEKIELLKKDMEKLNPEKVIIPSFSYSAIRDIKKKRIFPGFLRFSDPVALLIRVFIPVAMIIVLVLFAINYFNVFDHKLDYEKIEAMLNADDELIIPDSNSWWTERRLVITIIHEDNRTYERIITSNKEENIIRETFHY